MDKIKIKVQDVLDFLKNGKTRDEIAEHYGISKRDCKELFKHPRLKGKKTHKAVAFVIVEEDDIEEIEINLEVDTKVEKEVEKVDTEMENSSAKTSWED